MNANSIVVCAASVSLALAVGSAHAATINLLDADSYKVTSSQVTHTIPVDAGSADIEKLILSTHKEGLALLSVKYNNVDLTLIPGTDTGDTRAEGIWELDNPALSSGNIVVTFDGSGSQLGLAFAALGSSDGNDIAVGSVNTAAATSISLAVPNDDSFVFVAGGGNGGSRNMAVQSPLTRLTIDRMNSMAGDAGYEEDVDTGGSPYTYTVNTSVSGPKLTAASFYVIPEPASLALLSLGGLLLARRRG